MAASTRLAVRNGATVRAPRRTVRPEFSMMAEYDGDLLRAYGQQPKETIDHGTREVVTHLDLVERLLDGDPLRDAEPDLVMVAYALPDVHPFNTTSTHLNWRLGNRATSFAVAEQGLAAPFSALRIAAAYARLGRCDQAVLAVLEQTSLPNDDPVVDEAGLVDSAALLLLGTGGEAAVPAVDEVWTQRTHADCARALGTVMDSADPGTTLLVEGPRTGHAVPADEVDVHRHADATYCTSVWLALADHPEWTERYATIVLHDTDPRSGTCAAAVLRTAGAGTAT